MHDRVTFEHGDRVKCTTTGDDGLPLLRYGFVRSVVSPEAVIVMFDGEIAGEIVDTNDVELVSITSIELRLDGHDLLDDPDLRRGLTPLWRAEADDAGLDVDSVVLHDAGQQESVHCWSLASLMSGGVRYVLRALRHLDEPGVVRVRADVLGASPQQHAG
jgi:hypothetical protein